MITAHSSSVRHRRHSADEEVVRATRALSLVQMGELSATQQALEGASFASGNFATLGCSKTRLEDHQCQEVSQEVRDTKPAELVALDPLEFLTFLQSGMIRSLLLDVGE